MIEIRKSRINDISQVMPLYEGAKLFMRKHGNMTQWINGYPSEDVISQDMLKGNHYIGVDNQEDIVMAFTFIIGEDPTYGHIKDGAWLNDDRYGTIHRIASSGKYGGMLSMCVDYCFNLIDNIRVDTHADNRPMIEALQRLAFKRCGIISLADGSPRIAFQKLGGRH